MGNGGNCVEIANVEHRVYIQDSKHPDSPALEFSCQQWQIFASAIKSDQIGD